MRRVLCSAATALGVAAVLLVSACNPESTSPRQVDWPSISGQFEPPPAPEGVAGEELPFPIQVKVTDALGPVQGVTVEWSVQSGGGSLFVTHSSTDANGIASNRWTLGTDASLIQTVHAKAVLSSGEAKDFGDLTLDAIAGPPDRIFIEDGDNQQALHGTAVAKDLKVRLEDQHRNAVPGIPVTFAVATGGGNLGGIPPETNKTVPTGADGVAALSGWKLESAPCRNTLVATATGFPGIGTSVIFSATAQDCWSALSSLAAPQTLLGAGVANGFLYAMTGNDGAAVTSKNSAFIPSLNVWLGRASTNLLAREGAAVAVVQNRIYVIGGCSSIQAGTLCPATDVLGTVQRYDPVTDQWTLPAALREMPTKRANLAVAVIRDTIWALGGDGASGVTGALEAYDPATDQWTTTVSGGLTPLSAMSIPRAMLAAVAHNGKIYAVGGVDGLVTTRDAMEAYDPGTNLWSPLPVMPTKRLQLAIVVVGDTLYALGGSTANQLGFSPIPSGTVEAFDLANGSWLITALTSMLPRFGLAAGAIDDVIYAVGGSGSAGATDVTQAYYPHR